ncbi:FG-GAP-like repeat-containing protein [Streptomyces sp. NPDC001156]
MNARSSATRRGRIALTLASLAALGASSLTTAGPVAADTSPTPVQTDGVWGIDYAGGFLTTVENTPSGDQFVIGRRISADGSTVLQRTTRGYAGTFAVGSHAQRVPCDADGSGCVPMRSFGNSYVGYFMDDGTGKLTAHIDLDENSSNGAAEPVVTGARFVDATGRYYVYQATSTGKQYVDAVQGYYHHPVRLTRSITAASLWGQALWAPGSGNGVVTAYDLEKGKTVQTVSTGAPCTVKELQVIGRWIYWNCGPTGAAGVYDRTAKKDITVPSGPVLVGDGYLVQHDRSAGKLMLTDYHSGTAAPARAVADLPAGNIADQRRLTWTVDKFGGDIAYVDQDQMIRIVQSGVPTQPLAAMESEMDDELASAKDDSWKSTWQLTKPATWTFRVKDPIGRTVRTLTGSGTDIDVDWNGKTDSGTYAYNGKYTWTLTATAADGGGTYTSGGTIALSGGRQAFHDQGGYSYGELVTLGSNGALTLHYTEGKGTFDWKRSASGWPAGTVAVPFGDMGTDRCAEMLVRMPNGELRRYAGKCGDPYTPSSSHTSLGTGWNQYDVLTSPGDISGDGRADLLARNASTGAVYLYKGTSTGKLSTRVKLYDNWKTYKKVVGVGDLNGDGIGDLIAQDKSNVLYHYYGTGKGTFATRVRLFTNWGSSYNVVVGVGDITGDGKADIVARDTAGNLYRQSGYGNGSFAARVKIGTGWQQYKGIF